MTSELLYVIVIPMINISESRDNPRGGSGKAFRAGMLLIELFDMFPDEDSARQWFEGVRWAKGRYCGHCASIKTREVNGGKPMPYWCADCRSYFSVKTGTPLQAGKIPMRKWALAMYLMTTSMKGVSSMKLYRDLGITQKAAWHMAQRIRKAWEEESIPFIGPVEVDETYIGRKEGNKHANKKLNAGRGVTGKVAIVGAKDRATNSVKARAVDSTSKTTLHAFINDSVKKGSKVYTDDARAYIGLTGFKREAVKHGIGEYVRQQAHTNGIESFWSMLKRGYVGTYHKMSFKHLGRYSDEFAGRHNVRRLDTVQQLSALVLGMSGARDNCILRILTSMSSPNTR